MAVLPRQYAGNNVCYDSFGNAYYCRSTWNSWGRWVALVVILVIFFLFFFLCSCFTARRRRLAGRQPYYGTGWASRTGHGQAQYNPNFGTQQQPNYNAPPAYGQTGGYYGENNEYYSGPQPGTEMQPPQNVYRGDPAPYQTPSGPPPKKNDGIVR